MLRPSAPSPAGAFHGAPDHHDPDNTARLQRAQVHATLALVTATIQAGDIGSSKLLDWQRRGFKT